MHFRLIDATAELLARCRRADTCGEVPLDQITSEQEAEEIQLAALDALGFDRKGYSIVGSSGESRRTLGLSKPLFSAVPASAYYSSGARIRLPWGTIGAQCEVAFTMLRTYPEEGEPINRTTAAEAILAYQPAIGILGHRAKDRFLGDFAAIADFGLHVATVLGDYVAIVDQKALANVEVNTFLFKSAMVHGALNTIFNHPLDALVWLASELSVRRRQLQPNEVVTTGSCTTILQVIPGQHLAAEFGALGQVECLFE